jgi:hypothetical protein
MREKITAEGYTSLDVLVKKDKDWVRDLRISIKRSSTGNAASREVTLVHEESLVMVLLWAKLRYLTQRPLTNADATLNSITEVADWYNAQEAEHPTDSVPAFSATLNRRDWFEIIQSYLAAKKGKAGVPLNYVVSTTGGVIDPAVPAPGFGLPNFDEDLAQTGRHDGVFWAADNNSVWRLLEMKCRGTDSWNTLQGTVQPLPGRRCPAGIENPSRFDSHPQQV